MTKFGKITHVGTGVFLGGQPCSPPKNIGSMRLCTKKSFSATCHFSQSLAKQSFIINVRSGSYCDPLTNTSHLVWSLCKIWLSCVITGWHAVGPITNFGVLGPPWHRSWLTVYIMPSCTWVSVLKVITGGHTIQVYMHKSTGNIGPLASHL